MCTRSTPFFFVFFSPQGGGGGSSSRTVAPPTMMATPLPETPDAPPTTEELRTALVYGESATRSFVKALVWRLTAGVVTLVRRRKGLVVQSILCKGTTVVVVVVVGLWGAHALFFERATPSTIHSSPMTGEKQRRHLSYHRRHQ